MSKSLTLYELSNDFQKYMDAETDEELAMALADLTAGQIEVKAESYCQFIASLDGFAEQCKAESQRISKVAKAAENKAARLKERMKDCLELANIDKLTAGTFKIALQKNPAALRELDKDLTPASYRVIIPETWEPDKSRIKDALKAGDEVAGYELSVGTSLRIR